MWSLEGSSGAIATEVEDFCGSSLTWLSITSNNINLIPLLTQVSQSVNHCPRKGLKSHNPNNCLKIIFLIHVFITIYIIFLAALQRVRERNNHITYGRVGHYSDTQSFNKSRFLSNASTSSAKRINHASRQCIAFQACGKFTMITVNCLAIRGSTIGIT